MAWPVVAMAGAQLAGSYLQGKSAEKAAETSANAQLESARIAANAAKFRPYSISSGFGRSYFDTKNNTAGYDMDARLKAMQDAQYGGAAAIQEQLAGYDPEAMAAQVYAEQQGLMAPTRLEQDIALRQQQLQRGRIGLGVSGEAVGAGAGTGMLNPEQYSLNVARARADAELAAKSRDYGQAYLDQLIGRGQGLFSYGMGIEEQAMKPLTIGSDIGNRAAVAGANQGQMLLAGGTNAAKTLQAVQGYSPVGSALQGLGNNPAFGNAVANMFNNNNNYNPASWSNPAGSSGFYQNSDQAMRDYGNMS